MHIINPYRYAAAGGGIPVVEAFQTTTGVNNITVTAPAGITSGEMLLILISIDGSAGSVSTPAGWTELTVESGGGCYNYTFYKISDGTETDVTIVGATTGNKAAFYIRVSASSIDVSGTSSSSTGFSHAITEVTTTVDNCLAFYSLAFDGADTTSLNVSGTGWSESGYLQSGSGGVGITGCWGTKEMATAGATGTATVASTSSDGTSNCQFAVAPA